ncbi:MAG: polynucleotide adenylyltransferase PcnB [Termitinemataceae bacterium]|nr:MAG: polynucleotide adenylyltransferase PcnB [Termitinemataceae bacterium]
MRIRYSKNEGGKTVRKAFVYTKDEHKINNNFVDEHAVYICKRLREEGFETYIVGGAVRDLIIGKKPKDFDIASAANPAQIKKVFRNSRVIGRRFRLVHVFFGTQIFEVATFRSIKDGTAGNTFGTIEEDVLRRDFTFNALFYEPEKCLVIDYVGGLRDIQNKKLHPIIPVNTIFKDDPVRMLRAVKYSVLSGFKLPFSLRNQIRKEAVLLGGVSPSRLTEEINKIIHSANVAGIVENLEMLGLYVYLQPNAHDLMKKSESFKRLYFTALKALNFDSNGSTDASEAVETKNAAVVKNLPSVSRDIICLSALFVDYIEGVVDWVDESAVLYKTVFQKARSFVLPMNPQRVHIDKAVRNLLAQHGISIRKSRILRPEVEGSNSTFSTTLRAPQNASSKPEEGTSKPHRRRRRRKPKNGGAENTSIPNASE